MKLKCIHQRRRKQLLSPCIKDKIVKDQDEQMPKFSVDPDRGEKRKDMWAKESENAPDEEIFIKKCFGSKCSLKVRFKFSC